MKRSVGWRSVISTVFILALLFGSLPFAFAAEGTSLPEGRSSPHAARVSTHKKQAGGKSVTTRIEPHRPKAEVVGESARDPSRNGEVNKAGALSIDNTSSMGVGLKFNFGGGRKKSPSIDQEKGDKGSVSEGRLSR